MSSDAPMPPAAPDITLLFGPMLISVLLNTTLYGVMAVQAFIYYTRYRGDRLWFRMLVLYLVVVETANVLCDIGLIYEPLIIRYATPQALMVSPILLRSDGLLTVLVSTPIQLFIAWRVRIVTRSAMLPILISVLAIVSFGGGIAVTTIVSLHPNFSDFPSFKPEVITWLVSTSACDVLLTGSLVYSLWIRKTSVIATDSYLNKIIRLTVQTGFITAAAALLDMFLYIFMPGTTLNFIFDYPLSKLYTNALLSTLNARPWREDAMHYTAPNVLFEQTPSGGRTSMGRSTLGQQTSFGLVQRPTVSFSHAPNNTYGQRDQNKFTLDTESEV